MSTLVEETFPALPEKNYSDPESNSAMSYELFPAEPEQIVPMCVDTSALLVEEVPALPASPAISTDLLRQAHRWLTRLSYEKSGFLGSKLWQFDLEGYKIQLDLDPELPCHVVTDPEENIQVVCEKNIGG